MESVLLHHDITKLVQFNILLHSVCFRMIIKTIIIFTARRGDQSIVTARYTMISTCGYLSDTPHGVAGFAVQQALPTS